MEESLHTAARRALREFRIADIKDGGLIGIPLIHAMNILDIQVEKENVRVKARTEAAEDEAKSAQALA